MPKSSQLQMTLGLGALAFLGILILLPLAYLITTNIRTTNDMVVGETMPYVWEPWDIRFAVPPGMTVEKINPFVLRIYDTGVSLDPNAPRSNVYLIEDTTLAAMVAEHENDDGFSISTEMMNDLTITTLNYDDGWSGPRTVYLVQIGDDVMEYNLGHVAGTAGGEYLDMTAGVVLSSLKFEVK